VFPVDILTSYIVCGVGALFALAMMLLVRTQDAAVRAALRPAILGDLLLGVGLAQLLFSSGEPGPVTRFLMLAGSVICMPALALAFARLSGAVWLKPWVAGAAAAACVVALLAGQSAGELTLGRTYAVAGLATALMMLAPVWRFVLYPRDWAERALGVSILIYAISALVRCIFTLTYSGPPLMHHLYLPESMRPLFAVFYGGLPLMVASLMVNVINERLSRTLRLSATTDGLTGLLSRRAVHEVADRLIARPGGGGESITVLMIDLDHFKSINDRYGHSAGDLVLQHAATVLRSALRADTWLSRYGGEEFVVLLRGNTAEVAGIVAERLRATLAKAPCTVDDVGTISVTASVGVALARTGEGFADVLKRADAALYRAKNAGRNRVELDAS
jgi:diguanylate cyclase (GGDEF)-like protein